MSAVYTVGAIAITFDRPLLDGADDPINLKVGIGLGVGSFPGVGRIAEDDVATLAGYAAGRTPQAWSGPDGLPDLIALNASEEARDIVRRPLDWPEDQRRIVWGFARHAAYPRSAPAFQADAFQADAFQLEALVDVQLFGLTLIDAGPA